MSIILKDVTIMVSIADIILRQSCSTTTSLKSKKWKNNTKGQNDICLATTRKESFCF